MSAFLPSGGSPTCVAWSPSNDKVFVSGDVSGEVSIFDLRQTKASVFSQEVGEAAVHRLAFSPKRWDSKKKLMLHFYRRLAKVLFCVELVNLSS